MESYRRIRLGIGHPGHKDAVMPWVLGDFSKIDREWLLPLLDALADNADLIVKGDDSALMNKLAIAVQRRRRRARAAPRNRRPYPQESPGPIPHPRRPPQSAAGQPARGRSYGGHARQGASARRTDD